MKELKLPDEIENRLVDEILMCELPCSGSVTDLQIDMTPMMSACRRLILDAMDLARTGKLESDLLSFDRYQKKAHTFATYPTCVVATPGVMNTIEWVYAALNLAGEAGETAGKFAKIVRDKLGSLDGDDRVAIAKELGDVLWHVSELAHILGFKLSEIAEMNLCKLASREQRGVLAGSGDDR